MTVVFMNAWGVIIKGGPMLWPIFFLSVIGISVGIEKFLSLNTFEKRVTQLKMVVLQAVRENQMKQALVLCEAKPEGLGNIYKAGLMKFGSSQDVMRAAMREVAAIEVHGLKQRLSLLALVTNLPPLFGLLGTLSAMCVVFHAVQMRSNALNPLSLGDMSSGIWQALITTCAGLAVGILNYTMYQCCASRVNDAVMTIEKAMGEMVSLLQSMAQLDRSPGEEAA